MIPSVLSRRPAVTAVLTVLVVVVVVMVMGCRDVGAEMHGNGVRVEPHRQQRLDDCGSGGGDGGGVLVGSIVVVEVHCPYSFVRVFVRSHMSRPSSLLWAHGQRCHVENMKAHKNADGNTHGTHSSGVQICWSGENDGREKLHSTSRHDTRLRPTTNERNLIDRLKECLLWHRRRTGRDAINRTNARANTAVVDRYHRNRERDSNNSK